jgi:hypothetical protein
VVSHPLFRERVDDGRHVVLQRAAEEDGALAQRLRRALGAVVAFTGAVTWSSSPGATSRFRMSVNPITANPASPSVRRAWLGTSRSELPGLPCWYIVSGSGPSSAAAGSAAEGDVDAEHQLVGRHHPAVVAVSHADRAPRGGARRERPRGDQEHQESRYARHPVRLRPALDQPSTPLRRSEAILASS